jgi:hypothetical protein
LVDGGDLLQWQRTFGSSAALADGDGDGVVGAGDLAVWRSSFGGPAGLAAVPEPASCVVWALALPALCRSATWRP